MASNLGTLTLDLIAKIGGFTGPMDKVDRRVKKSGRNINKYSKNASASLKSLSASFLALAAVAGSTAAAMSVRVGAQFQQQMRTVQGVMRGTAEDLKKLSDAAKLMGSTTEWTATQSGEALNYMGMAGYSAKQSIEALPGILNLATAAGMDLGQASDIVTDSLTAMGMGVNDLSRFNDVLIGTITSSNTNVEQLGEALKYAAPIAAQLGYEIEEVSAMLGILANAGIKASDAGTDLRGALIRNRKAAEELGTAQDDLIGTLIAAKEAGWGVNEVVDAYGIRAAKSVLVLMSQIEEFQKLENTLHNVSGETQKLADLKLDTLIGDYKIFKSVLESIGIASFEVFEGDLREGLQSVTDFMSENKDDIIEFAEGAAKMVKALGQVAVLAGDIFSDVLSGWNSLPSVIQTVGIVGAIAGGASGRLGILATLKLLGMAQKRFEELLEGTSAPADTGLGIDQLKMKIEEVTEAIDNYNSKSRFGKNRLGGMTYLWHQQALLKEYQQQLENATIAEELLISEKPSTDTDKSGISGRSNVDVSEDIETEGDAREKLTEKINKQLDALQLELDTYGMSEKEIALYKLQLEGATEAQIASADALLSTIDALEQQEKAEAERQKLMDEGAELTKEMRTATEVYADEMERLNELLEVGAINQETYARAQQALADQGFEDAPKFNESGDFDQFSALEEKSAELEKWYQEQLDLLEQYRQSRAGMESVWDEREQQIAEQHAQELAKIETARTKLMLSSASSAFGEMASLVGALAGEESETYKAMFAASKAFAIAEATLNMFQAISQAGTLPFPANLAAMAVVAGQMATIVSSITSVGMAHDGIDSVPQSGSWLLEKGERVTTANTSKKLDKTLDRIQNDQQFGGGGDTSINIYEAPGTSAQVRKRDDGSIDVQIELIEEKLTQRMQRGSGIANYMDRRYGRKY